MLPRGINAIIQILAVLKAGAGYVPIDPHYPAQRVEWTLQTSQPICVLTTPSVCSTIWPDGPPEAPWCHLRSTSGEALGTGRSGCTQRAPRQGELAYVIFTSGSTGNPKGVAVGHRQVLNLLDAVNPKLGSDHTDTWSLFHSLAFDFSVWELWGALTTGARLCIVPQESAWSAEAFAGLLREEKVTILNQTPSAFYALSEAELKARAQGSPALSLRCVIFGGEALNLAKLAPWWTRYQPGQPRLINMYGITETTVHVTWLELAPHMADIDASPIGRALPSLQVHLLSPTLQPIADGEVGEIYVSGSQLAEGYLGRPDLTASRFIASPLHCGERLYRSGDLAVRRGGQLYYRGRADRQLKIRGFRIEPSEIEAAIETHPAIESCCVLPEPTEPGSPATSLLAFVITAASSAADTPTPNSHELRQYLAGRIPAHCLPKACVGITQWPLTVNGKLDQDALLQHWRATQKSRSAHQQRLALLRQKMAAPRTPHEHTIHKETSQ